MPIQTKKIAKILESSRMMSNHIDYCKINHRLYKETACVFNDSDMVKIQSHTMSDKLLRVFDAKKETPQVTKLNPNVKVIVKSMSQPI